MSSAAQEFVDNSIKSKKVVLFSKHYCPFCVKAIKVFKEYNLSDDDYLLVELTERNDANEIQDYLNKLTGGRTVTIE
jgi:glutaredoxin 3